MPKDIVTKKELKTPKGKLRVMHALKNQFPKNSTKWRKWNNAIKKFENKYGK